MNINQTKQNLSKLQERPLTYNEWCLMFNVSTRYVEPTKYFKGNSSSGLKPMEMSISPIDKLINFLFK
jgi:hypothetical protein